MTPDAVVGPVPEGRDAADYDRERRRVLWSLPVGLYVLGTRAGGRRNLMTVSWVTQVAQEPKLVGVGVETGAYSHELVLEGGVFALSLLPRAERALVRKFVKPVPADDIVVDADGRGTMRGVAVHAATTGAPVLEVAVGFLDCALRHHLPLGSHSFFVGEVVDAAMVGTAGGAPADGEQHRGDGVLRMEDTRMSYGG